MNILMLGWELPPYNSGGLGVACYHMAKALAKSGVSIDFVLPYSAHHSGIDFMNIHAATNIRLANVAISSCNSADDNKSNSNGFIDPYVYSNFDLIEDPQDLANGTPKSMRGIQKYYIRFIEHFVKDYKPDAIHAHDWLTMEAGMRAKELTGAPLIIHVHATEFDRSGDLSGNPLVHEIEYQGLMMADRIIAVSGITKNIIIEKYNIPADKIEVVHNGIDIDSFANHEYDLSTYKYIESLKNEGYCVVTVLSRFTVQKGMTHFIRGAARACEKIDNLVFLLVGNGEQRDELIKLSADLGISDKTFFTGFVRGKQWRDAYNVADIFVMSSVSEPFGLTALEAAHHNTALIISKQSGVGEILHSIFRYDFWDVDMLADQIIGIATSPALKQSLTENVKNEYSRISWNDVAKKCAELYMKTSKGAVI